MKLGEMLVRDGRITSVQVDAAIAHQARVGGRIGSVMVELGFIDAETLTIYLGLMLGMPIATGATLERCKRSAVRLLTPQQAARYRCVPIVIQGQTLILAIDDPHDMQSLDALHNVTGYRILPRIAPEIRLYYYLERFYGVARPPRYEALGEMPRGNQQAGSHAASGLPGPPLPGLPPRRATPVPAPTPRPVLRRITESTPPQVASTAPAQPRTAPSSRPPPLPAQAAASPAEGAIAAVAPSVRRAPTVPPPTPPAGPKATVVPASAEEALELDANDLVIELEADDAEVAGTHVGAAASHGGGNGAHAHAGGPVVRSAYDIISLELGLSTMASTDQRGAVADALLGWASGVFHVGVLCLVRDHMALGWKGFGPGLDIDRLETLLIPLEMPSIFQIAVRSRELFHGHAFPATLHDHIFKVLRCGAPPNSAVSVVAIGARVVNLLYTHKPDGSDLTDAELDALRRITAAAGEAYVRLISASKAQKQ
jgi:hypothetical protein